MASETVVTEQTCSIHPVDQMLPVGQMLVYGLQHVLAMYAGAVAVPLILASALKLSQAQLIYLLFLLFRICVN